MIDILMATYNSEKFINAQIDSIINQTHADWKLIIRDDGSSDTTTKIIQQYEQKYPDKIKLHQAEKNCGAKENFNQLLKLSNSEYTMFCDHDDFWLPNKIELTFNKMKEIEKNVMNKLPILVFTDKSIADEKLNIINLSSVKAEKFNAKTIKLNGLLVQNIASGCTIMINKKLLEICGEIPKNAIMHDHYCMLIASIFGIIGYVDTPTMLYRQHLANEIGATPCGYSYFFKKIAEKPSKIKERFKKNVTQAKSILDKYDNIIPIDKKYLLEEFIKLGNANRLEFIKIIVKNKFYKNGFIRKIGMVALLF